MQFGCPPQVCWDAGRAPLRAICLVLHPESHLYPVIHHQLIRQAHREWENKLDGMFGKRTFDCWIFRLDGQYNWDLGIYYSDLSLCLRLWRFSLTWRSRSQGWPMFAKRASGQSSLHRLLHGHQGSSIVSSQRTPYQDNPQIVEQEIDWDSVIESIIGPSSDHSATYRPVSKEIVL